jgi:hypothetical protein
MNSPPIKGGEHIRSRKLKFWIVAKKIRGGRVVVKIRSGLY